MLATNIRAVSKIGTQARLQCEALRLFAEQGYDATTTAQIAAAAGVTQMTFFRHFSAKELVVVDDPYDPVIAAAVASQPADLPLVERVRRGLLTAWGDISGDEDATFRQRLRIGATHPGLRARMRENTTVTEEAITAALVDTGATRFEAAVAAAAVLGALTAALLLWAEDPDAGPLGGAIHAALAVLAPAAPVGEQ